MKKPCHFTGILINASALNIVVVFYVTSTTVFFSILFLQQKSVKCENVLAQ